MRPILLTVGVILLIASIARFVWITSIIWYELLTPARIFNLTWMPTIGVLIASIILGYCSSKGK